MRPGAALGPFAVQMRRNTTAWRGCGSIDRTLMPCAHSRSLSVPFGALKAPFFSRYLSAQASRGGSANGLPFGSNVKHRPESSMPSTNEVDHGCHATESHLKLLTLFSEEWERDVNKIVGLKTAVDEGNILLNAVPVLAVGMLALALPICIFSRNPFAIEGVTRSHLRIATISILLFPAAQFGMAVSRVHAANLGGGDRRQKELRPSGPTPLGGARGIIASAPPLRPSGKLPIVGMTLCVLCVPAVAALAESFATWDNPTVRLTATAASYAAVGVVNEVVIRYVLTPKWISNSCRWLAVTGVVSSLLLNWRVQNVVETIDDDILQPEETPQSWSDLLGAAILWVRGRQLPTTEPKVEPHKAERLME